MSSSAYEKAKRYIGHSEKSLEDALRKAVEPHEAERGDILRRYEMVEVRGVTKDNQIASWFVVLRRRIEGENV